MFRGLETLAIDTVRLIEFQNTTALGGHAILVVHTAAESLIEHTRGAVPGRKRFSRYERTRYCVAIQAGTGDLSGGRPHESLAMIRCQSESNG